MEDYEINQAEVGLIFAIIPMTYFIGTIAFPLIIPKFVEHRVIMIFSMILLSFFFTLVGPFYTELSIISMTIGLGFTGFFMAFMCIPNMSEMI